MKIGIIDMGTNTFHLLITRVEGTDYEVLHKERVAVKIGEKGLSSGEIVPEAIDRAVATILRFKEIADEWDVSRIFATATSAIRNAINGKDLVRTIASRTGIEVQVISGEQEAELILLGAREALDLGKKKNLIIDIGGGSIEFIIANQSEKFWLRSFEIGGQRLIDRFHKNDPITPEEIDYLKKSLDIELMELQDICNIHQPETMIGCSGTFDTLSDIYCAANGIIQDTYATEYPLPIEKFRSIATELIAKKRAERLKIPGMIELRVDMIVVACILVEHLLNTLGIRKLRVSGYALKEGVLMDTISSVQKTISSN